MNFAVPQVVYMLRRGTMSMLYLHLISKLHEPRDKRSMASCKIAMRSGESFLAYSDKLTELQIKSP